jgi:hypothetical protein
MISDSHCRRDGEQLETGFGKLKTGFWTGCLNLNINTTLNAGMLPLDFVSISRIDVIHCGEKFLFRSLVIAAYP